MYIPPLYRNKATSAEAKEENDFADALDEALRKDGNKKLLFSDPAPSRTPIILACMLNHAHHKIRWILDARQMPFFREDGMIAFGILDALHRKVDMNVILRSGKGHIGSFIRNVAISNPRLKVQEIGSAIEDDTCIVKNENTIGYFDCFVVDDLHYRLDDYLLDGGRRIFVGLHNTEIANRLTSMFDKHFIV